MGQCSALSALCVCLAAFLWTSQAALVLPLHHRTNIEPRGRRLLRNASLPLQGSLRQYGYFFATLQLGTPARHFSVIVDTGSTVTYVPCSNCGENCGGNHQDAAFDPSASNTSLILSCQDPGCKCGRQRCGCSNNQCTYVRRYAEESSSEGVLVRDKLVLPDSGTADVVFGCETKETGEIYRQQADGLMGLGSSDISVINQLAGSGVTEDMFSLCFGSIEGDGALLLGNVLVPPYTQQLRYTPMVQDPSNQFYMTALEQVAVGNSTLPFDQNTFGGTILDSGTTFTYLPPEVFERIRDSVAAYAEGRGLYRIEGPDPNSNDVCWGGGPAVENADQLPCSFPSMRLRFAGEVDLPLPPQNYLFAHFDRDGAYCLGIFQNVQAGSLLGGITFRDILVQYDRNNARVGFAAAPCQAIGRRELERQRPGASTEGALCNEPSVVSKTVAVISGILPDNSSPVQLAALVTAAAMLLVSAVLAGLSLLQYRQKRKALQAKMSTGDEHDEISLISPPRRPS